MMLDVMELFLEPSVLGCLMTFFTKFGMFIPATVEFILRMPNLATLTHVYANEIETGVYSNCYEWLLCLMILAYHSPNTDIWIRTDFAETFCGAQTNRQPYAYHGTTWANLMNIGQQEPRFAVSGESVTVADYNLLYSHDSTKTLMQSLHKQLNVKKRKLSHLPWMTLTEFSEFILWKNYKGVTIEGNREWFEKIDEKFARLDVEKVFFTSLKAFLPTLCLKKDEVFHKGDEQDECQREAEEERAEKWNQQVSLTKNLANFLDDHDGVAYTSQNFEFRDQLGPGGRWEPGETGKFSVARMPQTAVSVLSTNSHNILDFVQPIQTVHVNGFRKASFEGRKDPPSIFLQPTVQMALKANNDALSFVAMHFSAWAQNFCEPHYHSVLNLHKQFLNCWTLQYKMQMVPAHIPNFLELMYKGYQFRDCFLGPSHPTIKEAIGNFDGTRIPKEKTKDFVVINIRNILEHVRVETPEMVLQKFLWSTGWQSNPEFDDQFSPVSMINVSDPSPTSSADQKIAAATPSANPEAVVPSVPQPSFHQRRSDMQAHREEYHILYDDDTASKASLDSLERPQGLLLEGDDSSPKKLYV